MPMGQAPQAHNEGAQEEQCKQCSLPIIAVAQSPAADFRASCFIAQCASLRPRCLRAGSLVFS